jgi:flagellar hook-associated protein 3 FlgL
MRISYSMIYDQTEFNINKQYENFFKLNEKVVTGKEVNRPSDNPIAMSNILGYRSTISSLEQYETNIERGSTWLRYTEAALTQAEELIVSARTLAVQMSTGTNEAQLGIIASQVRQIAEQLLQIANTSVSGKFLFSGHKTETLPFTMDEDLNVTYHGDNNKIKYSVDETTDVAVNITGHEAFMDGTNAFDVLKKFHKALTNEDYLEVGPSLAELDAAIKQIVEKRAIAGISMTRFESAARQVEQFKFLTEDLMIDTEDTDMVKRFTDLKAAETAFNAALQSSSMITRLSLLNYI